MCSVDILVQSRVFLQGMLQDHKFIRKLEPCIFTFRNFYKTIFSFGLSSLAQPFVYCEAQGKGWAKGGPRKVTQRSFMDGGWWMVVYLSLMLYTKFGCVTFPPPPPPPPPTRKSLNLQD